MDFEVTKQTSVNYSLPLMEDTKCCFWISWSEGAGEKLGLLKKKKLIKQVSGWHRNISWYRNPRVSLILQVLICFLVLKSISGSNYLFQTDTFWLQHMFKTQFITRSIIPLRYSLQSMKSTKNLKGFLELYWTVPFEKVYSSSFPDILTRNSKMQVCTWCKQYT